MQLYADLKNFSIQEMPTVNTSQNPLLTIKKPTPDVKTDYAEITHFIKVDVSGVQAPDANASNGWDVSRETIMQIDWLIGCVVTCVDGV